MKPTALDIYLNSVKQYGYRGLRDVYSNLTMTKVNYLKDTIKSPLANTFTIISYCNRWYTYGYIKTEPISYGRRVFTIVIEYPCSQCSEVIGITRDNKIEYMAPDVPYWLKKMLVYDFKPFCKRFCNGSEGPARPHSSKLDFKL